MEKPWINETVRDCKTEELKALKTVKVEKGRPIFKPLPLLSQNMHNLTTGLNVNRTYIETHLSKKEA